LAREALLHWVCLPYPAASCRLATKPNLRLALAIPANHPAGKPGDTAAKMAAATKRLGAYLVFNADFICRFRNIGQLMSLNPATEYWE
jgi:hypothetical protein